MKHTEYLRLKGFYENELVNNILSFWLPRCVDEEYGGYLNCFDNEGKKLVSYDKYTWSQGRFMWIFSRLASTSANIFTKQQRAKFLKLAKHGKRFLIDHCLMNTDDVRCVFLMERDGTHKCVEGYATLDMSIYADCFVVLGMNAYAKAAGDTEAYEFAKKIYRSILERVASGKFNTLPYPLSEGYRAHGVPMILTNVTQELYESAQKLDPGYCQELRTLLEGFVDDILTNFIDENDTVHEIITKDNRWADGLLGQHANPGHTIEDMWFLMAAADTLGQPHRIPQIERIVSRALEIGWDKEQGGLLHYVHADGGTLEELAVQGTEPTEQQVLTGWGDKLWWIHSEALYTTLLCYYRSGEKFYWHWHEKIFEYTFRVFPNRDSEIREWKQICRRDGKPQDKVVALPVKDPFHITRNLLLILELLEKHHSERW